MQAVSLIISALLLWVSRIQAQQDSYAPYFGIDYDAKAAYFTFQADGETQYVFALNPVANGDVFFHMSGPVAHSWLGVGFGSEMKDSFMILAYPSSNGLNTTISTRIATGHTEPVYDSSFEILKVYNDTYAPNANTVTDHGTGVIIAHAVCLKCSKWLVDGKEHILDTKNTKQPFIFALGPKTDVRDDSPSASLPRHGFVGSFTMDMTHATNSTGWYGRVPAPNIPDFHFPPDDDAFALAYADPAFGTMAMDNPLPSVHAVLMCLAFVIVFPTGAVVMQFLKQVLWHAGMQAIGFVAVIAGFGVAASFSRQYNKSKDFRSAHQVIGLLIVAALIIQLGLGLIHHSMYVRSQKPTPFGRIHFFLGPFIMLLGLINAGIGFNFAGHSNLNIPYGIVVAVIALVAFGVLGCQLFCRSRRKYKPDRQGLSEPQFGYNDYEMPRHASFGEHPPDPYEPPTPYTPDVPAPYTPLSAYTPITPNSWKKDELTRWPTAPYKEHDDFR